MSSATPAASADANAPATRKEKLWLPLESNPSLMNKYMGQLGVQGPWEFLDVYGTDDDLLGMVPQPVLAVMLLFPISGSSEAHKQEEEKLIQANGQAVSNNLYFIKQTVGNACGTIGLIHCIANVRQKLHFEDNKFFAKFLAETANLNPHERAAALEKNQDIEVEHQVIAADPEAKSSVEDITNINLHFIAFVHADGHLYELDGRKEQPINHGPTTADTLLQDSVKVIKQFMARDPAEIRFNMVALGPKLDNN